MLRVPSCRVSTVERLSSRRSCLPGQELAAEILELAFVHERFVLGGTIVFRQKDFGFHGAPLAGAGV
jgi:hypothetical protein